MSEMKIIVSNSLEDSAKPKTVYTLTKPSQYFNVKEPVFPKYKSDLAYKCTCTRIDFNELYAGKIERRFEERSVNHNKCDKKSHI